MKKPLPDSAGNWRKVNRKFSELYGDYSEHLINESEYLTLKQQYLLKSEALKKENMIIF